MPKQNEFHRKKLKKSKEEMVELKKRRKKKKRTIPANEFSEKEISHCNNENDFVCKKKKTNKRC